MEKEVPSGTSFHLHKNVDLNVGYKWYNKYVQKIQNKNVQMLYCYRGGKQYDHKKQHYFKFKN